MCVDASRLKQTRMGGQTDYIRSGPTGPWGVDSSMADCTCASGNMRVIAASQQTHRSEAAHRVARHKGLEQKDACHNVDNNLHSRCSILRGFFNIYISVSSI